jgi:predicted MFS family arabinose efflux permease
MLHRPACESETTSFGRTESPDSRRVLFIGALSVFTTSLFMRAIDPVIPVIAGNFAVDTHTAALLATAHALSYALAQPLLGSVSDMVGKAKVITASLLITVAAGIAGAFAQDFSVLLASRVLSGFASGGIFPIALAIAGDLVPVERRQVTFGRLMAAAMIGNLLGSPIAGAIADTVGWRGVFMLFTALALVVFVVALVGLRGVDRKSDGGFSLARAANGFRTVLGNPLWRICFSCVFLEGVCVFGLYPYVAVLLAMRGEERATIAGLVIAGFAIGGIVYSIAVGALLGWLGERRLMIAGGIGMAAALVMVALGSVWMVDVAAFLLLGLSFYSLHGVIQIYSTELAPNSRGLGLSLHAACFFAGQAVGPLVYGRGLATVGATPTLVTAAVVLIGAGFVCAGYLRRGKTTSKAAE